jgi:predicted nucleic acid-binding protein
VFISIVQKEVITSKDRKGTEIITDRCAIGLHVISKIEQKFFKGVISPYTYAECFKKRQGERMVDEKQDIVIEYLNNDTLFDLIVIDRTIGVQANSLCRSLGIMPTDAIHIACAMSVGCDTFLTWDGKLAKKAKIPGLLVKEPQIIGQVDLGI